MYEQTLHTALHELLGARQLVLVRRLLGKQAPHVRVGRLDHRVEAVGVALVAVAALQPRYHHLHRLREVLLTCRETHSSLEAPVGASTRLDLDLRKDTAGSSEGKITGGLLETHQRSPSTVKLIF